MDNIPPATLYDNIKVAFGNAVSRYVTKMKERDYTMRIGDRESLIKTYFKEELESSTIGRHCYHREYRRVKFIIRSDKSFMLDYPSYYSTRDQIVTLQQALDAHNNTLQAVNKIQAVDLSKKPTTIQEMQAIGRHPRFTNRISPVIIDYPEMISRPSRDFADLARKVSFDELHGRIFEIANNDISKSREDYLLNPNISIEEKLKHITDVNFNVNID